MTDEKLYRVLIRMKGGEFHTFTASTVHMDKFHITVTLAGNYNLDDVIAFDPESVSECWVLSL